MNIFFDNIIFSLQKAGGISVVWYNLIKNSLNDKNINVNFLEYINCEKNYFRSKLNIHENQISKYSDKYLFLNRYKNFEGLSKDKHIFHSSYYRYEKGINAINITTIHDFTYEHYVRGLTQKVHSYQKKKSIYNSQGIICISENTKKDLLKIYPDIAKKIKVIYNAADDCFKPIEYSFYIEKKHNFLDFEYAIYVGDHNSKYKNFDLAVESCMISKLKLLIIGGNNLTQNEIYELTNKLGKQNFIQLTNVSNDELNYYYNKAFCLLYPSLYEGFGIPVLEAQAAGCPVIASECSSIPEVIGNKKLAILNPNADKIAKLIKELSHTSYFRKESIEMGFEKTKQFSWSKNYKETIEFYNELYKK